MINHTRESREMSINVMQNVQKKFKRQELNVVIEELKQGIPGFSK